MADNVFPVLENTSRSLVCNVNSFPPILRTPGEKWFVEESQFPGLDYYPFEYCNGLFVTMTSDLIAPMLRAARTMPFFWIDDVYLFGLLPSVIGDVTIYGTELNWVNDWVQIMECVGGPSDRCDYLAIYSNYLHGKDFRNLWSDVIDEYRPK